MFSHSIYYKTLGIIGFGNIGKRVAKLTCGFNMKILALMNLKTKLMRKKTVSLTVH